jgi:hypothetical protein
VVVGRAPACLLRLDDPGVSAEHASIFWTGDRWEVRDLGSSNGTFVDGKLLSPGERVALAEGAELAFGGESERWMLLDASPPVASVRRAGTGEVLVAKDGLLVLPSAEDPEISIFENEAGRWLVESGGPARPGVDQEELATAQGTWVLSVPPAAPGGIVPTTRRVHGHPKLIGVLTLHFSVGRDGEHVHLAIVQGKETVSLGARAHNELLLALAHARLAAEQDPSVSEIERGWVHVDDLAATLHVEPHYLSVGIYRARQQMAEAGVLNAGALIERRSSTRQVRLGTEKVEIHTG